MASIFDGYRRNLKSSGNKRSASKSLDNLCNQKKRHINLDSTSANIDTDNSSQFPSYYKLSSNSQVKSTDDNIDRGKQKLCDTLVDNLRLLDELFHLRNFTSLVYFDPQKVDKIRQSESFQKFEGKYDLWPRNKEEKRKLRISSRVLDHVDPLRQDVMDMMMQSIINSEVRVDMGNSKHKKQHVNEQSQNKQAKSSKRNKKSSITKFDGKTKQHKYKKAHNTIINTSEDKAQPKVKKEFNQEGADEAKNGDTNFDDMDEYVDSDNESSEIFIDPLPKTYHYPSKLKLKYNTKPQIVTNPVHLIRPKFKTLQDYLDSFIFTMDDATEEVAADDYETYFNSQKHKILNVKQGLQKHLLRLDMKENVFRSVSSGSKEVTIIRQNFRHGLSHYKEKLPPFRMQNQLTHHDYLLAQGMKSSKLIHKSRLVKFQKGRKISQMIENHFKRLSQEEERKKKEFEKRKIKLAKETAREVKKRWLVAVKAFRILEEKAQERERAEQSKKELSKILDQSTKMLGAQLSANKSEAYTPIPVNGTSEEDSDYLSSSSFDSNETLESESIRDSNDRSETTSHDDDNLTTQQLREKYKSLEIIEMPFMSSSDSDAEDDEYNSDHEDDNNEIEGNGLKSLYDNDKSRFTDGLLQSVDTFTEKEDELRGNRFDAKDDDNDKQIALTANVTFDDNDNKANEPDASTSDIVRSKIVTTADKISPSAVNLKSLVLDKIEEDSDDDSLYEEGDMDTPTSSPSNVDSENKKKNVDSISVANVPIPSLLRGTLRPYQKEGLNWLASLYNNGTNGILADEMGLGKTIQTIALLAYLACEKNEWGPHLIVVPTSVILNWEMEFKRFAPGFKVLTYYGTPQQRKEKRKGWNTPDTFHVCITSYQLVVQDHTVFRRKKWQYMVLDEAHNIKNFRSQRWRSLLNFNTEHRLLLTGTPLQNNIIELWSLLYFLMPSSQGNNTMPEGFADLMDFQQWFGKPVDKIIQNGGLGDDAETKATVDKLHQVLRPYLLRRLKQDVEKQLPAKYEHIVYCRLSKRQRLLYDDFMSRAQTKETLASGNFLSIINCLMQLRKVCNHPDLFEVRPINTSFAMQKSVGSCFLKDAAIFHRQTKLGPFSAIDFKFMNLLPSYSHKLTSVGVESLRVLSASKTFADKIEGLKQDLEDRNIKPDFGSIEHYYKWMLYSQGHDLLERTIHLKYINDHNCSPSQYISADLIDSVTLAKITPNFVPNLKLVKTVSMRAMELNPVIQHFAFVTPNVVCEDMTDLTIPTRLKNKIQYCAQNGLVLNPFHDVQIKETISFPDKSLLQYDCGKLQKLAVLLEKIIPNGHRVLIFTQMAKMLDVLEKFLNYNGYTYMRLDGATKIEDRQLMTERFNRDDKIKCFILSTRSGGLGINLTGADTVVFYDSDWNPAMDKQCQDRCHRIGQTRDVHIYRFVSEYTIESNILKKANQKRQLDNVVIQEGDFTTDYFSKITIKDLLGKESTQTDVSESSVNDIHNNQYILGSHAKGDLNNALEQAEDVEDAEAAKIALKEVNVDADDFTDQQDSTRSSSVGIQQSHQIAESEELATKLSSKKNNDFATLDFKNEASSKKAYDRDTDTYDENSEDCVDEDDVGHIDEYMIRFIAGGFYF